MTLRTIFVTFIEVKYLFQFLLSALPLAVKSKSAPLVLMESLAVLTEQRPTVMPATGITFQNSLNFC